jgi:hypothetical protein
LLIIANEASSGEIHPDIKDLYDPGSEGAPGVLAGVGAEYFFARKYAATVDLQYRTGTLNYGREAEFGISGFWIGAGVLLKTR